jgi:hypothetical protein
MKMAKGAEEKFGPHLWPPHCQSCATIYLFASPHIINCWWCIYFAIINGVIQAKEFFIPDHWGLGAASIFIGATAPPFIEVSEITFAYSYISACCVTCALTQDIALITGSTRYINESEIINVGKFAFDKVVGNY